MDTDTEGIDRSQAALTKRKYPNEIEAELDLLRKQWDFIIGLLPEVNLAYDVKQAFPDLDFKISVGHGFNQLHGALIRTDKATHVKELIPVLRFLRRFGYRHYDRVDYVEIGRVTFALGRVSPEGEVVKSPRIHLSMFVPQKGAKCEFKIVGHEQKPIYKLICDDGTEDVQVDDGESSDEKPSSVAR